MEAAKITDPLQWLPILGLGALMGAIGQVVRMIVGMKKLSDTATQAAKPLADCIEPSRMVVSLVLGAAAGALAAIGIGSAFSEGSLFTIAAAGYSGADFIEGFARRVSGEKTETSGVVATPDGAVG